MSPKTATAATTAQDTAGMKRGLPRWYEYKERFAAMSKAGFKGPDRDPVAGILFYLLKGYVKDIIDAAEKGKPLVSTWYGNASEILAGMKIDSYCPVDMILGNQPFTDDVELSHAGPTPEDTCGLLRQAAIAVTEGLVPTPTAMIAMLEPCDGQTTLHELYQKVPEWSAIPTFALDPPYGSTDDDYRYFAGELKRMIVFLEEQTGRKMDYRHLRKVCEETNKQYALWAEICELQHTVPAPLPSFAIANAFPNLAQHMMVGDPKVTWFFRFMALATRQMVKKGTGALPDERVRIFWTDLPNAYGDALVNWLAEEYGAIVVNSTWGEGSVYTPIDTSSIESMLYGIARRNLNEVPMIRTNRGTIDLLAHDVKRGVADYKANCVIFPGHKGHKDLAASVGFIRDICRDAGVPLLALSTDLCDATYMPFDQVQRRISEFFETQGWESIRK